LTNAASIKDLRPLVSSLVLFPAASTLECEGRSDADEWKMKNTPRERLLGALVATAVAALVALFYFVSKDRDFIADLAKALFGLSGGTTAGG
jgi:hypothetical protein